MPGIVWLASYPKSGNTWMRLLIHSVCNDGAPIDINGSNGPLLHAASRSLFDETLCVEASELSPELVERSRPRAYDIFANDALVTHYLKTHDAYVITAAGEPLFSPPATEGAVYILRDPRDLAGSLAAHSGISIDKAIAQMANPHTVLAPLGRGMPSQLAQRLLTWSQHVESWLIAPGLRLHVVRYEDMLAAPIETFGQVVDFLGLDKARSVIERAIDAARFDVLQAQERANGFNERTPRQEMFFRRGTAGGWRHELTASQVAQIEATHGAMMSRFGYL